MSKSEKFLIRLLITLAVFVIGVVVVLTIIAYQIGVDELERPNRIAIISGLLSMVGGVAGAFGAYFVATYQMKKQIEHEKKKEARQKAELLEHSLKKLDLLNEEAIEFVISFNEQFAESIDSYALRDLRLEFSVYEFQWIVDNVDNIDHGIMDEYGLDYLRFSRELHNAFIDIKAITKVPSDQVEHNLSRLRKVLSIRMENFNSFNEYIKGQIEYIQQRIETLN